MKDESRSHPKPGDVFIPYRVGNSALLESAIIRNPDLLSMEKLAWIRLSHFAGQDGECYPSYESLAEEMGTSRRQAIRIINGLVDKGFLVRNHPQKGWRYTPQYFFIWRDSFAESPFSKDQSFTPGSGNGNGRGDTHVTSLHGRGDTDDTKEVTSRVTRGDTHVTQSIKEEKNEKTTTTGAPSLGGEHNPDESLSSSPFVDEKATAQDASLIDEYVTLCAAWQAENGGFVKSRGAFKAFLRSQVKKNGLDMDDLEEKRAWKRDRDEEEEIREIARRGAIERENRKKSIEEEYKENCEPGFICLTEDEFYAMKHEEFSRDNDQQGLNLIDEIFPGALHRMVNEEIRKWRESNSGQETSGSKRKGKKPEQVKLSFEAFTELFDQLERNGCRDNTVWSQLKNDHQEFFQKWEAKRAHDDMLDKFVKAIRNGMSDHELLENDKALHPDIWSEAVKEAEKPIKLSPLEMAY